MNGYTERTVYVQRNVSLKKEGERDTWTNLEDITMK